MAAKRFMYSVEYRRFYLRDLESVVIWPNRWWWLRLTVPAVLLGAISLMMWRWVDLTFAFIFGLLALVWLILEVASGPTAKSRLRLTGMTVDLPLVMRTRRAESVLGKIDAALRAARASEQSTTPAAFTHSSESAVPAEAEASITSAAAASQTNAS